MALEIKGTGNTFIRALRRVLKIWHDDAGYFDFNGKRGLVLTTAITAGVTATAHPAGSFATTTHATGLNRIFRSDGTYWQAYPATAMAGHTVLGAVAAATTTGLITQLSLNAIADGATATIAAQPKTPRNLKITITDGNSGISAYSITVVGKAPNGETISETFTFADGLTPAGSKVFASLTTVTVNSIVGDGASDTLDIGMGSKLGLPVPLGATGLTLSKLISDGTIEAASAVDTTNNSFTPTTAPNGTKIFEVWFGYGFPA
ncbi:MAG: hypothetical protein ABL959_09560 [Pyrinomonadaceae bacterium]